MKNWLDGLKSNLEPFKKAYRACLKDTTDFLKFIKDVNIRKGRMDELTTTLTTRDIGNYYPSCDTEKCLKAIKHVVNENESGSENYKRSVLDAVRLTMTSNNCSFLS